MCTVNLKSLKKYILYIQSYPTAVYILFILYTVAMANRYVKVGYIYNYISIYLYVRFVD